jgi:hypothetical protein
VSGCTELAGIAAEGVLWTLCNGNEEEKDWDLLWHGRGCLGSHL